MTSSDTAHRRGIDAGDGPAAPVPARTGVGVFRPTITLYVPVACGLHLRRVHAVSHSQAQGHQPGVESDDLPVDGEHQQRYQRKHPQPHEQHASHRAEDVLVTDFSMLEHPNIREAPLVQESAPQATAIREHACRDILVWVNTDSGHQVTACQHSDALPLAHTVFTEKIRRGQRPGHDHRRDVHQPMGSPEATMHRSFGEAVR